jgi:putative 2OG-Fe(II) oxygenase
MSREHAIEALPGTASRHDLVSIFERDGFLNLASVLDLDEVSRLQLAAARLLGTSAQQRTAFTSHRSGSQWAYRTYSDGKTHLAVDVVGADTDFDLLLEKILANSRVNEVLASLHGPHYKVTQVNIRKVVKGDPGLGYHQDTDGETGIGILLEDRPDAEGTTTFLPGSHRWPFSIRELFIYPRLGISLFPAGVVKASIGRAGDMYFFINRLWHGRAAMHHTDTAAAILIAVFAKGSKYRVHQLSDDILARLGPVTRRLLDHNQGVRDIGGGLVKVLDPNPSRFLSTIEAILVGRPKLSVLSPWQLLKPWRLFTRFVSNLLVRG